MQRIQNLLRRIKAKQEQKSLLQEKINLKTKGRRPMDFDLNKLEQEETDLKGDSQIRNLIDEVRREMAEERIKKCQEANDRMTNNPDHNENNESDKKKEKEEKEVEDEGVQLSNWLKNAEEKERKEAEENEKRIQEEKLKKEAAKNAPAKEKQCQKCGSKQVSSCAGCKVAYYCSEKCQRDDWKNHKAFCQQKQEEAKEEKRLEEKKKQKNIDWFRKIENAGQGNFSIILKMEEKSTGQLYAIKVIEKRRLKQLGKEKDILMEKHALKKLADCPYAAKLYDTFQDELTLYIQMEYVDGGELWNYCRVFGLIAQSLVKYFFAQIIRAIESIHAQGIIHRDIKPENILVVLKDKSIKFCDFGTSRDAFDDSVQGSGTGRPGKKMFEHFVGTPNFMAPECLRNKASDFSSDIFSLGGLAFQLQTGFPPFLGKSEYLIFLQSEKQDPIFAEELWEHQPLLKDLILQMMNKDMEKRPKIAEIKQHAYFKGIDWENLPSYEESLEQFTNEEKFFQRIKADLLEKFDSFNEKGELLAAEFADWGKKLAALTEFSAERLGVMQKKLEFMHKQAKQFFNVEEFFWQDFTYQAPNQQAEKQPEDTDDQEEDDQKAVNQP